MTPRTAHRYEGLTEAQAAASRKQYGANVVTPPTGQSVWRQIADCRHFWLIKTLVGLAVGCAIAALAMRLARGGLLPFARLAALLSGLLVVLLLFVWAVAFLGGKWQVETEASAKGKARGHFEIDPLVSILLAALVLGTGIAFYEVYDGEAAASTAFLEPLGIGLAVLLATGVAHWLEASNEKTFRSLEQADDDTPVRVVRQGNVRQVPRREVVVGDIVLLSTGEEVPADCRLLEAEGLTVNESMFTGEPLAEKSATPSEAAPSSTYPANLLLKGSIVLSGTAVGETSAVGDGSESGRISTSIRMHDHSPTPLSRRLNQLAALITKLAYAVAALVVVGRTLSFFLGHQADPSTAAIIKYMLDTVMIAVSLVVVAVPEGLPMAVTLSLAFSMRRLMQQHTLPRTMHACETMGAASVICTDKTGTLTQNRMQVADALVNDPTLIAEAIALNTTADLDLSHPTPMPVGSPTEGALLLWLHGQGIDYRTLRQAVEVEQRLGFSTEWKYMATVVRSQQRSGHRLVYLTGAPDILLALCHTEAAALSDLTAHLALWQQRAYRTLGIAVAELSEAPDALPLPLADRTLGLASPPSMLALFALSDPIRPDVPQAIAECRSAGIDIKIVTGDTPGTALEVGRQIGLTLPDEPSSAVVVGADLASLSDDELRRRLSGLKIVARARPADKERVVRMLKAEGHVVATTGDGTNDAPALHHSDVGLSMGDGTAVAKEASDMTILDNSFATIAGAVMWGRSLYKNIQRFILFQLTVNVAACLVVMVGSFLGTELPLTVPQMLWVNLIMDTFAALALASLPPSHSVMHERPRPIAEHILHGMWGRILGIGGLFAALMIALLLFFQHFDVRSTTLILPSSTPELTPYELTLFFTLFVMLQFWNMFNAKAFMTTHSAFHSLGWHSTRWFLVIALVIVVGQVLMVELGGEMMGVAPEGLSLADWLIVVGGSSIVLWVGEALRTLKRKQAKHNTAI